MENSLKSLKRLSLPPKGLPERPGVYVFFKSDTPIYIGKAINLKRRVSSYFDLHLEPKTFRMRQEATALSFIEVDSELQSLLLEAKLIRKYMPHYNIAAKDDKHPLYIVITKETHPRVITARKIDLNKGLSLATYGPFPSSNNVRSVLRMLRRILPYSDHKIGKRACIYSHIGLCSPCPNEISKLKSQKSKLEATLKYKKNIKGIKSILDGHIDKLKQSLEKEMKAASVSQNYEEAGSVRDQIERLEYITRPQIPTDFFMQNPNLVSDVRKKELNELTKLLVNCSLYIVNLNRIECFDIAHLGGTNATASMVTFIDGVADKSLYRHFRIRHAKGSDDYTSMREVAERRKRNFEAWGKPDLIIVDGSVGQVSAFKEQITSIPIVGIAKHPDRLIVGENKIKLTGAALNLVSRMRDEAHRFARRYHHKLISSSITKSIS